nr:hypothetical protein [Tanacetum cinerariifolium]
MRQPKNLMDINIDALYNILKQNQGDVNNALGYKKKVVVVSGKAYRYALKCDADHTWCHDTRHSTSGSAQFVGDKPVSWSSKKQKSTAISSTEIPLYCDNKSAIALCCNDVQHSRAKHINVRYHFIKEQVENRIAAILEDLLTLIKELGYSGKCNMLSTIQTDQMNSLGRHLPLSLTGTLKFISKIEDYQIYGAVIPDGMINDDIKLSKAYKNYLDYATGKVPPYKGKRVKKAAKKATTAPKPVLSSEILLISLYQRRKHQLRLVEAGIELLSDAALLEEAQMKKTLKKKVLDEPTWQTKDTSKGTSVKPGVPDVSKDDSSDINNDSWGKRGDESDDDHDKDDNDDEDDNDDDDGNNDAQDSEQSGLDDEENPSFMLKDYEEEEQDEEYVFSLKKYKFDDEEKMFKEEDDDVAKELYGDLNIT